MWEFDQVAYQHKSLLSSSGIIHHTPVTPEQFRKVLKSMLTDTGLDSQLYNVHSLRIGRAVDMHEKLHISVESIKKIGRWQSNSVFTYLS